MAASITGALARIKGELDLVLPGASVDDLARAAGHRWRDRLLTPAVTVHLCLLQLLARVALAGLAQVAGVAASAQAFCKARQRLPVALFHALVERAGAAVGGGGGVNDGGGGGGGGGDAFRGHRVLLVDGTSFVTPDTPGLADRFGKGGNARGPAKGYPVPKLLALVDRGSGAIRKVVALPHARQERTCPARLFRFLAPGDLLLGDRGLASFAHLALILAGGWHACLRLPRWLAVSGRGAGRHRRARRLGKQDLLVTWRKSDRRPAWLSRRAWAALPDALALRQVTFRVGRGPGFRPTWVRVVTTLLDPAAYPAAEVAELYGRRWRVEVCFRDLKRTLGLGRVLSARTPAGVRKEVLCHVLLYNLVRQVVARAARRQGVAADRVGFTSAATWLLWSSPGDPLVDLVVNPARPGRPTQPRRLKRGRKKYPPLNAPRAALARPPATATI
jgi:hypothetical protein